MFENILISFIPAPGFDNSGPEWILRNRIKRVIDGVPGIARIFLVPYNPEIVGVVWRSYQNYNRARQTVQNVPVATVAQSWMNGLRSWTWTDLYGRNQDPLEVVPNEEVPNEEFPNEEVSNEEVPNEEVPNEEVPDLVFNTYRNIPKNSTNAVTLNDITNGNMMVDFHNRYSYGNYFKKNTYNSLPSNNESESKLNPITRQPIKYSNLQGYKARIVGGHRKSRVTRIRRTRHRSSRRKATRRFTRRYEIDGVGVGI